MKKIFERLNAVLEIAMPKIYEINWPKYGNYQCFSGTCDRKYQGILFHFESGDEAGYYFYQHGILTDSTKSARIVRTKVRLLQENRGYASSLELRDPDSGKWGGGIRVSRPNSFLCGITGLPELGDHLLLANLLYLCDFLTHKEIEYVVAGPSLRYIDVAMKDVGMSTRQFGELKSTIFDIVMDAQSTTSGIDA